MTIEERKERILAKIAEMKAEGADMQGYLENDKKRLDALAKGDKMTKRSLLALLAHGIDGNNVTQMKDAKKELEDYLVDR